MAIVKIVKHTDVEVVSDVICDICGKTCRDNDITGNYEVSHLWASWGYGSRKDGTFWEFDFCEDCSDKLMEFIKTCKGSKLLPR